MCVHVLVLDKSNFTAADIKALLLRLSKVRGSIDDEVRVVDERVVEVIFAFPSLRRLLL